MRVLEIIAALSGIAFAVPVAELEVDTPSYQKGSLESRRILGTYYAAPDGNGIYLVPNEGPELFLPLEKRNPQVPVPWERAQPAESYFAPLAPAESGSYRAQKPQVTPRTIPTTAFPRAVPAQTPAQGDQTTARTSPWWRSQQPGASTPPRLPQVTETITLVMQAATVTVTSTAIDLCILPPETNTYQSSTDTRGPGPTPLAFPSPSYANPSMEAVVTVTKTVTPWEEPKATGVAPIATTITQTVPGHTVTVTKTEITTTTVMITLTKEAATVTKDAVTVTVTAAGSAALNGMVSAVTKWYTAVTTVNLCSAVNLCAAFPSSSPGHF